MSALDDVGEVTLHDCALDIEVGLMTIHVKLKKAVTGLAVTDLVELRLGLVEVGDDVGGDLASGKARNDLKHDFSLNRWSHYKE